MSSQNKGNAQNTHLLSEKTKTSRAGAGEGQEREREEQREEGEYEDIKTQLVRDEVKLGEKLESLLQALQVFCLHDLPV
jgi:hypothetical protein